MNRLTRIPAAIMIAGAAMLISNNSLAFNVDSFFDIHYEVSFDPKTQGPEITARVTEIDSADGGQRTVQTEMLSMSLSSHSPKSGVNEHNITLRYSISNIGSSGQDGVRYGHVEIDVTCKPKKSKCVINGTRSMSLEEYEHRGHVTVLK